MVLAIQYFLVRSALSQVIQVDSRKRIASLEGIASKEGFVERISGGTMNCLDGWARRKFREKGIRRRKRNVESKIMLVDGERMEKRDGVASWRLTDRSQTPGGGDKTKERAGWIMNGVSIWIRAEDLSILLASWSWASDEFRVTLISLDY